MTVHVITMQDTLFPTLCSQIESRADNLLPTHAAEVTNVMWLYGVGVGGSRMWKLAVPNRRGCLCVA